MVICVLCIHTHARVVLHSFQFLYFVFLLLLLLFFFVCLFFFSCLKTHSANLTVLFCFPLLLTNSMFFIFVFLALPLSLSLSLSLFC